LILVIQNFTRLDRAEALGVVEGKSSLVYAFILEGGRAWIKEG